MSPLSSAVCTSVSGSSFERFTRISNGLFAAGVVCVVLGVLGGTTWATGGFWAPDGAYSQFVWPIIFLVWILVVTRIVSTQRASTREGW